MTAQTISPAPSLGSLGAALARGDAATLSVSDAPR